MNLFKLTTCDRRVKVEIVTSPVTRVPKSMAVVGSSTNEDKKNSGNNREMNFAKSLSIACPTSPSLSSFQSKLKIPQPHLNPSNNGTPHESFHTNSLVIDEP